MGYPYPGAGLIARDAFECPSDVVCSYARAFSIDPTDALLVFPDAPYTGPEETIDCMRSTMA